MPGSRTLLAGPLLVLLAGCASAPPPGLTTVPREDALAARVARLAERTGARMGIVALHVESGRELRWNDRESFEAASVIKLSLLSEALGRLPDDSLDLDDRWKLFRRSVASGSGILDEFDPGLMPTNRDLLRLMLALSDNTAANHFIDTFGQDAVNCRMSQLGLSGIQLVGRIPDREPLETEDQRWKGLKLGRMTPRDTAELWRRIATESLFDRPRSRLALGLLSQPETRNRIPRLLLGEGVTWAGKTGTMHAVRNDSGILTTPKGRFVLVMFADRIPDRPGATIFVNQTMGEIAKLIVTTWSRDLPDRPFTPYHPPRQTAPALPRVELTPLEARAGGPFLERVWGPADRLFWKLWAEAGGDLSDACLIPMPNSWWAGDSPQKIQPITTLVLHHTAIDTDEGCIELFLDPASFVSSHFLVGRDGRLYQFVSLEDRAWHAGESLLHGRAALNRFSIGVEITGNGNRAPYTPAQIETVSRLVGVLVAQFGITAPNVAGHEDIAPVRKVDPGVLFPWNDVMRRGLELAHRLEKDVPPPG